MSFPSWLLDLRSARAPGRGQRRHRRRGSLRAATHRARPRLELLEDRAVPSTFTVTNLLDDGSAGSLRGAISQANAAPSPDTIAFAPSLRGTVALDLTRGELDITGSLTIDGPGVNRLTVSGNDASRVFNISGSTTDVEITRLTIAGGSATGTTMTGPLGPVTLGGGILNNGGHLIVSHVTLADNQVVGLNGGGGAIANVFGATLTVDHSTFTGNESVGTREAAGGAIANDAGSSLSVAHSTFTGNQATSTDASAGNGGGAFGGAISNRAGSQATVLHSTFANNLANGGDGANGGPAQNGGNGGNGGGGAIANLNDSFLVAAAGSTLIIEHTAFTSNQCIGGAGGNGGANAAGGNGLGGNGGGILNLGEGSTALVTHSTFTGNQATAGAGGNGGDQGRGGSGGNGQGGAIVQFSATLTVEHNWFTDNQATGGSGGNGGSGANGGAGGPGAGGAINSGVASQTPTVLPTLAVDHLMIQGNRATGGRGGNGGSSGNGGNGGQGTGGGIRARGSMDVAHSELVLNQATGGAGGDRGAGGLLGGNGGLGTGGGIVNDVGAIGTVFQTSVLENQASGGAGGLGGNGGNGQGGGIWNGTPNPLTGTPSTLTIVHSTIVNNRADGGAAGVGGSQAQGVGGGLYITPGGIVSADRRTLILANHASTSDDDVFGILGNR